LDNTLLLLKIIAVAHGVLGYVGAIFTLTPEIQDEIIYKNRNPLAGDIKKYLIYLMCFCLLICGLCPWFKPSATQLWAWLALGIYMLGALVDLVTQKGRVWCWRCMATGITLKAIAAGALTYLANAHVSAANG
jgi:hypothetical protein